jgi:hypothetical protein
MTQTALGRLLDRARGPLGPSAMVDFGVASGPFAELADVLRRLNGFFAFNAGVEVYPVGGTAGVPELVAWNEPATWKQTYDGLADAFFCFGQDVLGTQFAIVDGSTVVAVDPETAEPTAIGDSLEAWAAWLLDDPDVNATDGLAYAWQEANGPLALNERLIPVQLFVLGGAFALDNLFVRDAVTAMRIRGPIAQQIAGLPDGASVHLTAE